MTAGLIDYVKTLKFFSRKDRSMIVMAPDLPPLARNWLWPALLALAAIGGSWALACVMPFAAFAAMLAESERPVTALTTVALIWFANQAVGMTLLGYPRDLHSIGWGFAIGAAALLATGAATALARIGGTWRVARLLLGFAAAFAVYEAVLVLVGAATGELLAFAPSTVARLAAVDAAWLAALAVLHEALVWVGWRPANPRFVT